MKMRHLRYGLILATLAWAVAPQAGSAAKSAPANTFSGQCDLSGQVSFSPALTTQPQPVSQRAVASGTCSGQFVDRSGTTHQLSSAPMRFSETSLAPNGTCAGGTATGQAVLRFQYGKISAGFQEVRGGGGAAITLTGAKAGSAAALATVSNSEDPVQILQRCAGSGLESVRVDVQASTTPSISG